MKPNVKCPHCGYTNPATFYACSHCGAALPAAEVQATPQPPPEMICPHCHQSTFSRLDRCLHCRSPLRTSTSPQPSHSAASAASSTGKTCPHCQSWNPPNYGTCEVCGTGLSAPSAQPRAAPPLPQGRPHTSPPALTASRMTGPATSVSGTISDSGTTTAQEITFWEAAAIGAVCLGAIGMVWGLISGGGIVGALWRGISLLLAGAVLGVILLTKGWSRWAACGVLGLMLMATFWPEPGPQSYSSRSPQQSGFISPSGHIFDGVKLYFGPNKNYVGTILGADSVGGNILIKNHLGDVEWKDWGAVTRGNEYGQWYVQSDDPNLNSDQLTRVP